jgi:iron complex transport system substrate-binding protein
MRWGLALLALLASPTLAAPRVVSMNPCIDAILVEVAMPEQILAISHYSKDVRASSIPAAVAARFAATAGTAEEAVALRPDIVMAGAHVAPATVAALRRLGVELMQFGVPDTVADSVAQVRAVAAAVGRPARGAALAARIEDAAARAAHKGASVPGLVWMGGGLVPGAGTLVDEMMARAGFVNVSARLGLSRWDVLPLERLVVQPPRVLLRASGARGDRILGHPVLEPLAGQVVVRDFAPELLFCGGPTIIRAMDRLAAVRRELP